MSSPWKRVDLLTLASVTACGAAGQRRVSAAAAAASPSSYSPAADPQQTVVGSSTLRAARGTHGVAERGKLPLNGRSALGTSSGGTASPVTATASLAATRVSISRLLGSSSLTWQDTLACFVELTERSSHRGRASESVDGIGRTDALPLEAILSVLATLRRQEDEATAQTAAEQQCGFDKPSASAEDAQTRSSSKLREWMRCNANADDRDDAALSCSSTVDTAPSTMSLCFLAFASQHHFALEPIRRVLTTAFQSASHDTFPAATPSASTPPARPATQPWQRVVAQSTSLPVDTVVRLKRLLSVSTVLHVGLGAALLRGPTKESRTASPCPQLSPQQRWAAVRVLHHMVQNGGAAEYLHALAERVRGDGSGAVSAPDTVNGNGGDSVLLQTPQHETLIRVPSVDAAETLSEAYAALNAAATLQPDFSVVLRTLQEAWQRHNTRRLRPPQPPSSASSINPDSEVPPPDTTADKSDVSKSVQQSLSTKDHAQADDVDAAVAMVRAIGSATPPPSSSEETTAVSLEGAVMSTAELQRTTLDVLHLVWRAMAVLRRAKQHASAVARDNEGEALTSLVHAATRFLSFADLCTWLERLLPPIPLPSSSLADAGGGVVSAAQWDALQCLLARAVRRAPSWSSRCSVLQRLWPRFVVAVHGVHSGSEESFRRSTTGFAGCAELLNAFFDGSHAPAPTELRMWTLAICLPAHCSDSSFVDVLMPCLTSSSSAANMPQYAPPDLGSKAQRSEAEAWSRLLYGEEQPLPSTTPQAMAERHSAMSAAATSLVKQWLRPSAAMAAALESLAACHACCAAQWAATVTALQPHAVTASLTAGYSREACEIKAVSQLAEQHRAFSSLFLTAAEQLEWFNRVLCCTPCGVARQLVLQAAMSARWDVAAATKQRKAIVTLDEDHSVGRSVAAQDALFSGSSPSPLMLTELTRIFEQWINASDPGETATPSSCSTLFPASCHQGGGGRLGDVGVLFKDVATAATASGLAASSLLEPLCAAVRRFATEAGLRWERQQQTRPSTTTQEASTGGVAMPLLFGNALLRAQTSDSLWDANRTVVDPALPQWDGNTQRARLHEWLAFLRGCPSQLPAHEAYAVVWLYILMRRVEELHGETGTAPQLAAHAAQQTQQPEQGEEGSMSVQTALGGDLRGGQPVRRDAPWSAELEVATVRDAAAFLSRQLWSRLPPSSLLPPMLLNWLLTRGGLQTWGDAVRFLRTAAAGSDEDDNGDQQCASAEEDQRRYLYLGLPLDRVVSLSHVVRVLRTLRVVEAHFSDARIDTDVEGLRRQWDSAEVITQGIGTGVPQGHSTNSSFCGRYPDSLVKQQFPSTRAAQDQQQQGDDTSVAGHPELRAYYCAIERVLLREWYRRALAAVLEFVVANPVHVFLTPISAAPDHAALALRRRLAIHTNGANIPRDATLSFDTTGGGSATIPAAGPLSSRHQEATQNTHQYDGKSGAVDASPNTFVTSPDDQRDRFTETYGVSKEVATTHADRHRHCSAQTTLEATSTASAASAAADAAATHAIRIPLQLLGTFILQESRLGAPRAPSCSERSGVQPTEGAATGKGGGAHRRSRSTLDTLLEEAQRMLVPPRTCDGIADGQNGFAPDVLVSAARATDAGRPCVVHHELLELYREALASKTAEMSGPAATPCETVEDAVYDVLAHHAHAGAAGVGRGVQVTGRHL